LVAIKILIFVLWTHFPVMVLRLAADLSSFPLAGSRSEGFRENLLWWERDISLW
jgi:hypothetical protein